MKMLIPFLLLLVSLGCLSNTIQANSPKIRAVMLMEPDTSNIMRLLGRFGAGHACPAGGSVLTAAHVVNPSIKNPNLKDVGVEYAWEDFNKHKGIVAAGKEYIARDLGVLALLSGIPVYYKVATEEPNPGDTVYWLEYDFSTRDKLFGTVRKEAKLIRSVAGHFVLDNQSTKGSSGSCILNSYGEVVGIMVWLVGADDGKGASIAVSVSGSWWPEYAEVE